MIDEFDGEYWFLSNFSISLVEFEGLKYPTVEHAYQAAKTKEPKVREIFSTLGPPSLAKKLGRNIIMRSDFEYKKKDIMLQLLRNKFSDENLARRLLATGDQELVEGNSWYDVFWGKCNGEGTNWLGILLMEVRDELK